MRQSWGAAVTSCSREQSSQTPAMLDLNSGPLARECQRVFSMLIEGITDSVRGVKSVSKMQQPLPDGRDNGQLIST